MTHQAVTLKVTPRLGVECTFWLEDDGWNGSSGVPRLSVQASSFEQVKSDTELALGQHIEKLLREGGASTSEQAA